MKITCMFGQRRSDPDVIELMVAWDEYCLDENPEGFAEACETAKRSWGDDMLAEREVEIVVDERKIRGLFGTATISGDVVTEKPAEPEKLFVVRMYDRHDNQWVDVSKALPREHADRIWDEKTGGGKHNATSADVPYYDIFPSDTRMVFSGGFGES